jgi:hypothetical protein
LRFSYLYLLVGLVLLLSLSVSFGKTSQKGRPQLQPGSLCEKGEVIVFSCSLKRSGKLVSICSSRDVAKDRGYLQYRFGRQHKLELQFPTERTKTQSQFQYSHYFRARVDLTEISCSVDGVSYTVFDTYNGEEKLTIAEQGVTVTVPNSEDVTQVCRGRAKVNLRNLSEILPQESN